MGNNNSYVPMTGNGSLVSNGQIIPVPMLGQFFPSTAQAPFYYGNGMPPPTIPINYTTSQGGDMSTAAAASNPWSPTLSPLPVTIGALIVGLVMLRFIHWRKA